MERRELAVHHDDAVSAHRDRDVAALAFEHIGLVAEVSGLDLDLGEIDILLGGRGSCGKQDRYTCKCGELRVRHD